MHVVLCVSGKRLTILNAAVWLCGPRASLKLLMWPALSERLKTPALHDHSLYFVCPDLLVTVGETSYGIWG
jgi:hypothetical protein